MTTKGCVLAGTPRRASVPRARCGSRAPTSTTSSPAAHGQVGQPLQGAHGGSDQLVVRERQLRGKLQGGEVQRGALPPQAAGKAPAGMPLQPHHAHTSPHASRGRVTLSDVSDGRPCGGAAAPALRRTPSAWAVRSRHPKLSRRPRPRSPPLPPAPALFAVAIASSTQHMGRQTAAVASRELQQALPCPAVRRPRQEPNRRATRCCRCSSSRCRRPATHAGSALGCRRRASTA